MYWRKKLVEVMLACTILGILGENDLKQALQLHIRYNTLHTRGKEIHITFIPLLSDTRLDC